MVTSPEGPDTALSGQPFPSVEVVSVETFVTNNLLLLTLVFLARVSGFRLFL